MDQDRTAGMGSEDTSRAEEHSRNAEENRDALEAQSQRTDATAAAGTDRPVEGYTPTVGGTDTPRMDWSEPGARRPIDSGMHAVGDSGALEDASDAQANVREAERNRDALEAQSDRVERTTSSETDRPIGQ
ncbi:MAG TPA: hypothetical protein VJT67_17710 [Longimicrobiaceae bacterium]|nr:hypothetical protein [Longimicrobiaceae bacterium]